MQLHRLDISIIVGYVVVTMLIGFWVSKRASKNLDSYFLGGNELPWWVLGVSNASGMFDITGTMWLVSLLFVYGLKSVWIPWLWPVFNQIFLMVYLSAWVRRSNAMTGAEWITTRFGQGKGANLAYLSVVIFALVSTVGFLAYAFQGIGKFSSMFLDLDLEPNTYALIFMSITALYVIKGGMFSVVLTEFLQFVIMTVASIAIGVIAMTKISPEMIQAAVPSGWENLFFGWKLDLDWSGLIPEVTQRMSDDAYTLFTAFFMMMVFKGFLVSVAGPAPNYDMQRILATKNPKEASLMSGFVSVALFFPRFMMIAGLTTLALVFFNPAQLAQGGKIDFEQILPFAIRNYVPIGLMGVLLAGLLSAFMSTFAATVNAAPAYIVNDIYKRFIKPDADKKTLVRMSYAASLLVVVTGIGFGFVVDSIDQVTQWIVSALWGGYTVANVLKWHWWRFNGYGYFWGMITGIFASLLFPKLFSELKPDVYIFPMILVFSAIGTIIATLVTKPESDEVLTKFYKSVRPWGFWKPVEEMVLREDPDFKRNTNFGRDMMNVVVGIIWQTCLVAMPIYLIIKDNSSLVTAAIIFAAMTIILKKFWFDKLEDA